MTIGAEPDATDDARPNDVVQLDQPTAFVSRSNIDVGTQESVILTFGQPASSFDAESMNKVPGGYRLVGSFSFGAGSFSQSHLPTWLRFTIKWAAATGSEELLEHVESLMLQAIEQGKADAAAESDTDDSATEED